MPLYYIVERKFLTLGAFERKSPQGFSNYYPVFFIAFKARQAWQG